jgi:hypothetical protein
MRSCCHAATVLQGQEGLKRVGTAQYALLGDDVDGEGPSSEGPGSEVRISYSVHTPFTFRGGLDSVRIPFTFRGAAGRG